MDSKLTALEIPASLAASPFLRAGGFEVHAGLLDPPRLARLRAEAEALAASARPNREARSDGAEWRGGRPARSLSIAAGGPVQDAFYRAPSLAGFMADRLQAAVLPSGASGSYSYYAHGDFLGLHRDVAVCDVAVLTCLAREGPGGTLVVYPERIAEPLSAVRRAPRAGARAVRLAPGETAVLLGGLIPHAVLPLPVSARRVVSVLCFRVVA